MQKGCIKKSWRPLKDWGCVSKSSRDPKASAPVMSGTCWAKNRFGWLHLPISEVVEFEDCHCWKHSPCFEEEKNFFSESVLFGTWCGKTNSWGLEHQFSKSNYIWSICNPQTGLLGILSFHLVVYPTKMINQVLLLKQHRSDMDWGRYLLWRDRSISALPSAHIRMCICIYVYTYDIHGKFIVDVYYTTNLDSASLMFPSKIEWDLTNGPLRKLLELLDSQL